MVFRKNSLLFYQSQIFYIIMVILCLACGIFSGIWLSLLFAVPFVLLIIVNPKMHSEFIIIDKDGISCQKSEKLLWKYEWDDIAELKKSSRYLLPSIEIIAYNKCGKSEQFAKTGHCFQLCKASKKAVERFAISGAIRTSQGHN